VVIRVAPDSPAARAGLQPEDRVYRVNGRDFADDAELSRLLNTLPGPIRLQVERSGRLHTVEVQVAPAAERRAA
jgi:S1-C subfamily serine protease